MHITVFGATGGTGSQVVTQALKAGHRVTAIARDPSRVTVQHERLDVQPGDVLRAESIALPDTDAVISAIGPRSKAETAAGVQENGIRTIVAAMHTAQVRRLLVVSVAPLAPPDPHDTLPYRLVLKPLVSRLLAGSYADTARMEQVVRDSGLEWTIVRPPRLTNKPHTGTYRTAIDRTVRRGYTIGRADVADLLLRSVDDPATIKAAVAIGY
jgi:putative NADH-flavin reductase